MHPFSFSSNYDTSSLSISIFPRIFAKFLSFFPESFSLMKLSSYISNLDVFIVEDALCRANGDQTSTTDAIAHLDFLLNYFFTVVTFVIANQSLILIDMDVKELKNIFLF